VAATEAVILAGGLGTRLRPSVQGAPKSMALIAGHPFLCYQLSWLRLWGIRHVVLCIGYKGRQICEYFGNGKRWGLSIRYSVERKPLGTGGALRNAQRLLSKTWFLALNGDSLLDVDLGALVEFHRKRNAVATLALAEADSSRRYGFVQLGSMGNICSFLEKPVFSRRPDTSVRRPPLINGGVYVLASQVLDQIPSGRNVSLEKEVFPSLVGKGFYGFPTRAYFVDIGLPRNYQKAQKELPERFRLC